MGQSSNRRDRDRGIVEWGRVTLTRPDFLTRQARLVLGLWSIGITEPEEMAEAAHIPEEGREKFIVFAGRVMSCPLEVVQDSIQYGLPGWCSAMLPEDVMVECSWCRRKLNAVPCPFCARSTYTFNGQLMPEPEPPPDKPMLQPTTPTRCRPGTRSKVWVMERRVAKGQSPFHPDDAGSLREPA